MTEQMVLQLQDALLNAQEALIETGEYQITQVKVKNALKVLDGYYKSEYNPDLDKLI